MRRKPAAAAEMKPKRFVVDQKSQHTQLLGRDGLGPYIKNPDEFSDRVISYNDKFVVIKDMYPKSTVHLLILPRDPVKSNMRPQEAFDDPEFLADCLAIEKKVREIAISELRRKLGEFSATEKPRNEAMDSEEPPEPLPPGRDWGKEIMSGTHANPSMNHMHIHVLSRELYSERLKHRNHYQSFTTDFFIRMDEYPLVKSDPRREYKHFPADMLCWRCGRNFGNRMARLKEHLEEEFEEWKKE